MTEVRNAPRVVAADVPDRGRMYYLVDDACDFIPEVKEFLDWKAATNRAPATLKAYCSRLLWYYSFLPQRQLSVLEATPADLTEFVLWLCNPSRNGVTVSASHQPASISFSRQWEPFIGSLFVVENWENRQFVLWMYPEANGWLSVTCWRIHAEDRRWSSVWS